jgi:hypothetical protein
LENKKYINDNLATNFSKYLTNRLNQIGDIKLCLWGHNHWFIPYVSSSPVKDSTLSKGRLIGGSARHDYHSTSEIVMSGRHVINYKRNDKIVPLVPDMNNDYTNHTYAIIKLSDPDAEITYYQTPSWDLKSTNPKKSLPSSQHHVLLREYVLNTKPAEKYPPK